MAMGEHRVFGYDQYGLPVTEVIQIFAPSRLAKLRSFIMRWWPVRWWNVAYRFGLTKSRRINGIETKGGGVGNG